MADIAGYYQSNNPVRKVLDVLSAQIDAGKPLDVNALAALDSFHLRGRAATVSLAGAVDLKPGLAVLDVGAGPGGTARYLAERFGVRVVGLDLTHDFTRLAALLSSKTKMDALTRFICASALEMPFNDACFDGVWMEHVQMNIPDKARLAGEIHRVLKPAGFLAMYEVFQAGETAPFFPLPWADDPSGSFLVSPETMRACLETAGFRVIRWKDCHDDIRLWLDKRSEKPGVSGVPTPDVRLLMGEHATQKVRNFTSAVLDKRLTVMEVVCQRKP